MKEAIIRSEGTLQFCAKKSIMIAGRTLTPDPDNSYVEFYVSHGLPVILPTDKTGIHPQVVANSFRSLENKVFNLSHLMKKYSPETKYDRILGTVIAVEFPETPAGGWKVGADKAAAPCIRAVAVMHKAADLVEQILESWYGDQKPLGGEWTVSMENRHTVENSGFLVAGESGVETFMESTPADLSALGYVYVPAKGAPLELLECLNNEQDDKKDKTSSIRVKRDFNEQEVIFILGGIDGKIRYSGMALTPRGKEEEAYVSEMLASHEFIDGKALFEPLNEWVDGVAKKFLK